MNAWWIRLVRYGLTQWRGLLLILLFILLAVAADVLKPWPLKLILDNVLKGEPLPAGARWLSSLPGSGSNAALLVSLTAATVLLFLANWLCRMAQQYLQAGVGAKMVYALSADLFLHLQRLSLCFHGGQRTGDLVKRVTTDTECVRQLVLNAGLPLVTSLSTLTGMILIMWQLSPALALIALLMTPLLGFCIWIFAGPMTRRSYAYYELQGAVTAQAEQVLTALPLVRAFGQETREHRQFAELWRQSDAAYLNLSASQLQFKMGTGTLSALGTALVLTVGAYQVLGGHISMGSLVVFLSYVASLYAPLESLAYLTTSLSAAAAGARRVFDVFERNIEVREDLHAKTVPFRKESGHIRFENVSFGYVKGSPVLHGINLEAHPGEMIALVGPTGSGKSTLISLIPRLFDPWEGRITLDGMDVRELKLASLRAQISIVLQEPYLLPLTVAENIAYGRPDATREQVMDAAVTANADEFIKRLPQGYDTIIGERGETLSGGQRQRLAIARALLKNAPVLILDEPTSALDLQSESLFLEGLYRLIEGRTAFIIAHRLSTVRRAAKILVLEHGAVVARGTHAELMHRPGVYRSFAALQVQGGAE